jgi:hypothetical protein
VRLALLALLTLALPMHAQSGALRAGGTLEPLAKDAAMTDAQVRDEFPPRTPRATSGGRASRTNLERT